MRKVSRVLVGVVAIVTLLALDVGPAFARGRTVTRPFQGFSGFSDSRFEMTLTGQAVGTCKPAYCARVKAGRRERKVSIHAWDDASEAVLFSVGQDRNRDGDANDAGEYQVFCGDATVAIKPGKNVDVHVLAGGWVLMNGTDIDALGFCASVPVEGKITFRFA